MKTSIDPDLSKNEASVLCGHYYEVQKYRIAFGNQIAACERNKEEKSDNLTHFYVRLQEDEDDIKKLLDRHTNADPLGKWLRSICGIGPVLAAGLMAEIDIQKAQTPSDIWSFAGYAPDKKWKKGKKRPWNARLKKICFLVGESFVKFQNNDSCTYGKLYAERKVLEVERNERGDYTELAAKALREKDYDKTTEAYKAYCSGKLPPAHVHARARRWAVKIFLEHYFEAAWRMHYGTEPVRPYAHAFLDHGHIIDGGETYHERSDRGTEAATEDRR